MMGVHIEWDNAEKTIIRYDLGGYWTWDEFYGAFNQAKEMLSSVPWKVYFIMNPTDAISRNYMPPSVMTHVASLYRHAVPNGGGTVMVGGGAFLRTLHNVGSKLYPAISQRFTFKDTLEDARAYIAALELEPN